MRVCGSYIDLTNHYSIIILSHSGSGFTWARIRSCRHGGVCTFSNPAQETHSYLLQVPGRRSTRSHPSFTSCSTNMVPVKIPEHVKTCWPLISMSYLEMTRKYLFFRLLHTSRPLSVIIKRHTVFYSSAVVLADPIIYFGPKGGLNTESSLSGRVIM